MEVINKRRKVRPMQVCDPPSTSVLLHEPTYKPEIIRLIIQSLRSFGYTESAAKLEAESGIILEEKSVTDFKLGVLAGRWDEVASLIPKFSLRAEEQTQVLFCVMQQKYLELIEQGEYLRALDCLRNEVVPLKQAETVALHLLASHLLCSSPEELKEDAGWQGSTPEARRDLLHRAQSHIPPSVMVPPFRLQDLMSQALESQVTSCRYHHDSGLPMSLLEDHNCDKESVSFIAVQQFSLDEEGLECGFSRDGERLAVARKEGEVIVYRRSDSHWTQEHRLSSDQARANSLSWTQDNSLIVGSLDGTVKIVRPASQDISKSFACHTEPVASCHWVTGDVLVSGSVDNTLMFSRFDGERLHTTRMRVRQIEVSPESLSVAVLCACIAYAAKPAVVMFDPATFAATRTLEETDHVTAIALARSGAELLTNTSFQKPVTASQQLHLWNVGESRILQKYEGHQQQKFCLKPSFGGKQSEFVLCGSEDGSIFIWNKIHGTLLSKLTGHTAPVASIQVNAVQWSPTDGSAFVSVSDDHSVRMWRLESKRN